MRWRKERPLRPPRPKLDDMTSMILFRSMYRCEDQAHLLLQLFRTSNFRTSTYSQLQLPVEGDPFLLTLDPMGTIRVSAGDPCKRQSKVSRGTRHIAARYNQAARGAVGLCALCIGSVGCGGVNHRCAAAGRCRRGREGFLEEGEARVFHSVTP